MCLEQSAGHSLHNWEQQYRVKIVTSRLHSGNAWYLSGQNLLSSSLLAKNLKLKIYETIIWLLFHVYGIGTWSVALRVKEVEGVREEDMRDILGHKGV